MVSQELSGPTSIICSNKKISVSSVAFINTFLPRNYSFDDIFEPGVVHPGATIVMSALALSEWLKSSIDEFMEAIDSRIRSGFQGC
ncbi:MAG: MmgE/PrpD family protein [Actinobacteria bacterium]|nr:MmgE/PrpD family protein [Actinomycetota bacterium]